MGFLIKTRLILKLGQKGTKKPVSGYGYCPVRIYYRCDETKNDIIKLLMLIAEEADWYQNGQE